MIDRVQHIYQLRPVPVVRILQRAPSQSGKETASRAATPSVAAALHSPGQPLDAQTRAFMEPRFGHDFSQVRVHTGDQAAESARSMNALAYTVGHDVVFGAGQYRSGRTEGKRLLAHELTHVIQQSRYSPGSVQMTGGEIQIGDTRSAAEADAERAAETAVAGRPAEPQVQAGALIQRRAAPYIKKITVDLAPSQSAQLEWEGTPPSDAAGSDSFTVSTGKGYSNPGDPAGTCTRSCCSDAMTQCAPPWNQPGRVGACCTYFGDSFWTGTPLEEHNGWKWWTPIQPYYSSRGIALHQHDEVTGQPIGHGCVRMDEPNAKRIYDYSNGRRTNVTLKGRAAPVACDADRQCTQPAGGGAGLEPETGAGDRGQAAFEPAVSGLEGVLT